MLSVPFYDKDTVVWSESKLTNTECLSHYDLLVCLATDDGYCNRIELKLEPF
jgi:hypothetical protein